MKIELDIEVLYKRIAELEAEREEILGLAADMDGQYECPVQAFSGLADVLVHSAERMCEERTRAEKAEARVAELEEKNSSLMSQLDSIWGPRESPDVEIDPQENLTVLKFPPEFGDGDNGIVCALSRRDVMSAIDCWLDGATGDGFYSPGDEIVIRVDSMTRAELEALPDL